MDGASSEANEENDTIERPVRRRHSSILKPPRSPLQDLRSGNEVVQESTALRNRKSSRRVSFADTIKVFQTESHMKITRKSEIAETEAGENVLFIPDKNSEDDCCEITGMNTLLCAPIHTQLQQREFSVREHNPERKDANDQTVIFSDENKMDLTASQTIMITNDFSDCSKSEKFTKIDTTSFLANLKRNTEDSRMKKELNIFKDQNTYSEKKINSEDFIKILKTGKYNSSCSGPDKENFEIPISRVSNSASSTHQMHESLNIDENSGHVTRIFREQDDGMNFTQCHTANIQTLDPISSEANLREFKDDITIYGNDCMDLTVNHTVQILPSGENLSETENQTQNVTIGVTTVCGTKAPGKKIIFKNNQNTTFQDPFLNSQDRIHITRSHITGSETHRVSQANNQDAKTSSMAPESLCSIPPIQGYETLLYSSCNDAMELTKCLSSMREEKNLLNHDGNSKLCPNPDTVPLMENTLYSGEDIMDITKSHTVAIDNQIFKQDQTNIQIAAVPISEQETILPSHTIVSEDEKMNVNYSLVPHVSKERLQQSLTNPLSLLLTDKKTELLTGEDMDLTESHTDNLGIQIPLASHNLTPKPISESHSHSKSPSGEWGKKTEIHVKSSQQPNILFKNIFTDTQSKEEHQILKSSFCFGKDFPASADCAQDTATNHNAIYSGAVLDKKVAVGNNKSTVSSEQSLFPAIKLFSSQGQSAVKNHDIAENSHIVKSVLGENPKFFEPLRKNLDDATPVYSHDKRIIGSKEEQTMDLTKSHTVVIGFAASELQELGKTNLEHRTSQLVTVKRQIPGEVDNHDKNSIEAEKHDKNSIKKPELFISNNIDVLEDKSIQKPGLKKEEQNVKICGRKSIGGLKADKTIVFSESDENDMDITKTYPVEISHRPLLDKQNSYLVPVAGTSKSILYSCEQDDMEITRSHTTALEYKPVLPEITRPVDKTVMYVDNHNELEMTKSHTIFIDYHTEEKTVPPDRPICELPERKSLQKLKVTSTSTEENVFSKNDESDHPTAKGSELAVLKEWSSSGPIEKTVTFRANDNMEMSKLTTWENVNDVQKPGFLNESLFGKSQRRKSLRLKSDKTIAFSENDKNDTNITQSCMVEMNSKSALEDREDSSLVPLAGTSKTVLYISGHDDMEITGNHTTASECKTVSPDEIIRPVDKTVIFVVNHNDLRVTKSHTVFIDCEATEKILQEHPKFGITRGKNLSVYFPKDDSYVQEVTKKQPLTTENKTIPHLEQKHHVLPPFPLKTLPGNHNEMEIIKLHRAAVEEEVTGKVVDQACTLEKPTIESHHLNHTDRRNVDCISDPIAANYECSDDRHLPNTSSFDKLEDDKDKVRSNSCPVQNSASDCYLQSEERPLSFPCFLLEKEEAIQTNSKGQLDCAITQAKEQDLIKKPQDLLANQTFETIPSKTGNRSLNFIIRNSSTSSCENESQMLNNEKESVITYKKELKENIQKDRCNIASEFHSNSDLITQIIKTRVNIREASHPMIASTTPCYGSVKPNMNNLNGKTEECLDLQTVNILPPPEHLFELQNKAQGNMTIVQTTEKNNNIVSDDAKNNRDEENKHSQNEDDTTSLPLKTVVRDKMRRCSLGIFLPKLPNKRNCSVTGTDDLEQIPADTTDLKQLETQPVSSKNSGIGSVATKLNLSPSQYINEENLPIYPGEINSSDSISIEIEEKALIEPYQKEISLSENKMEETCNNQKRTWIQDDDDDDTQKKIRKCEIKLSDTIQDQEIFDHHTEGNIDKNVNSILTKSLSRSPSSCSTSLDSVKADGTSLDFSTHRNSQVESQFLRDTICEESLKEKLKDGRITIREFFILLQVHILIQKPRQSNLPTKFTINTSPTPEDLMLRQYVYGPKIQIYREDCEVLRQKIEELKVSSLNQDKLLTDVNRNLWEKMSQCSDEELKAFGIYLNKIKSRFTKMTKVFTHQGKVALYSKLVQSAQNEREKLQMRIDEMDNVLQKINNCLTEVEIETKNLEDEDKGNPLEEWNYEMRAAEKELEQLKIEEEELQRKLIELEAQKEQTLAQIDFMQKQTNRTEELLDQLSLLEWDIIEWSDDQAVFTFVYDTIELTITFGDPIVGLSFLDKAYRKIAGLNFQSLLDEDKAPPSSLLVHKLIFEYIEEQESWKKQCTTEHQVPKMLQELSLIVNHCRLLGEEIEFLKRWGPNYNLMDVGVNNTELRLLFSSSTAFAKFEITFSLSAHYPLVPLPFTFQNHLGNTGQDEIATVISKVPLEDNYLKNVVKQIYQDLLQRCHSCL